MMYLVAFFYFLFIQLFVNEIYLNSLERIEYQSLNYLDVFIVITTILFEELLLNKTKKFVIFSLFNMFCVSFILISVNEKYSIFNSLILHTIYDSVLIYH